MPFPSKGCRTCKRRKVKCDKSRPFCLVCQKVGRKCLGYDAEAEGFIFRNEVARGNGTIWRGSDLTQEDHETKASSNLPARTSRAQSQNQQLQATLCMVRVQPTIEEQAICFYWTHYLNITDHAFSSGMRSYIRFFLLTDPENQELVFSHAVATDSLLRFGKLNHDPRAVVLARKTYSAGLSEARSSLEHPSQACSDMFLVAVMIFSGYEIRSDTTRNPRRAALEAKCLAHQQGAISLLKVRQDPRYATHINRSVDRSVRRQIMRSCILRAWKLPDWLGDGANFGETSEELEMDRCLVEVIYLRCRSQKVFDALRTGSFLPGSFQELIQEVVIVALRIDSNLQIVLGRLRKAHSYDILHHEDREQHSSIGHLIFNNKIHVYHTEQSSNLWNSHRAARLICNSIIVSMRRYYDFQLGGVLHAVFDIAKATLSGLIDDVCESLSFHFMSNNPIAFLKSAEATMSGRSLSIDTERSEALVSVLIIASSTVCLDGTRKAWIKEQLGCIGKLMGSDTVMSLAS